MTGRKAQAEQVEKPQQKEAAELHRLLAGVREQMEYMLRDQFTAIEAAVLERMKERDARIEAAEALLQRLQQETAEREADQRRQAEQKLAGAESLIKRLQDEAAQHKAEVEQKLAGAEALIVRLQNAAAEQRAEAERQAEKMAKLRQLALESG